MLRRPGTLLLLVVASCGPPKDKDAEADAGDPPPPGCPFTEPAQESRCPEVGLQCEFGLEDRVACNSVATCTDIGWIVVPPDSRCEPPGEGCPDDALLITPGSDCAAFGITCSYPTGTCVCDGAFAPGGSDLKFTWTCAAPGGDCEKIRPHLGAACFEDGKLCSYGGCNTSVRNITQKCVGGLWRAAADECNPTSDAGVD